jgi:hypothetical protein
MVGDREPQAVALCDSVPVPQAEGEGEVDCVPQGEGLLDSVAVRLRVRVGLGDCEGLPLYVGDRVCVAHPELVTVSVGDRVCDTLQDRVPLAVGEAPELGERGEAELERLPVWLPVCEGEAVELGEGAEEVLARGAARGSRPASSSSARRRGGQAGWRMAARGQGMGARGGSGWRAGRHGGARWQGAGEVLAQRIQQRNQTTWDFSFLPFCLPCLPCASCQLKSQRCGEQALSRP